MKSSEAQPRRLLVQWRNDVDPAIHPIGVLTCVNGFRFSYLPGVDAIAGFRPLPPFPEISRDYEASELFGFFAVRILDERRPEYRSFLAALGLEPGADVVTVLGRSGGRRKGDFVSLVEEPHVSSDGRTEHTFLVHGVRHVPDPPARNLVLAALTPGSRLSVDDQPDNPVNSHALIVTAPDGTALGWVPDGLVPYMRQMLPERVQLRVVRINGPEQPDQLRLLVRSVGTLPHGAAPLPQLLAAV